ncbi:MAG: arylsulfatase [Saprospiraceae bacterium]|nr:arylsulfatase [Saprospiraceae bacterium]
MADDMGFSDLGCYGSEISTPHLDKLAKNGMQFTQFYNTGRCCPSRASLMTGIYPHQLGMGWMNAKDLGRAGYTGRLSDQAFTMAESLRRAGYTTYMVGKWHLTPTDAVVAGEMDGSWPVQRGFEEYYGTLEGAKDYFEPSFLYRNQKLAQTGENYFYTQAISDSAATFIRRHAKKTPFFLYAAYYAPHFPLHAPDSTIAKYRGQYLKGWKTIRQERFEKQKKIGLIRENTQMSKAELDLLDWDKLSVVQKDEMDLRMAIYAAQIEELDSGVGKLLDALEKSGQSDNTLIVFLSDNGAVGGSIFGKGERKNLNRSGPYTSYGKGWGHVSNTPYRKYKSFNHEGGIIAPLIVYSQDWVKAGSINRQPVHIIDLMPTFLDLAKATVPSQRNGATALEVEGQSLLPTLIDPLSTLEERPLLWEHEGRRAIRQQNWKLVSAGIDQAWELYDLSQDPTERRDLSAQYPEKTEELEKIWISWAEQHQVLPLDGRDWGQRLK